MSNIALVARGAMDQYLTGNPQISFFKTVYRRYTPFSLNIMKLDSVNCEKNSGEWVGGSQRSKNLTRSDGDLLCNIFLQANLNASCADVSVDNYIGWTNNTGCALVENYGLYLNNNCIDSHDNLYLDLYNELHQNDFDENALLNKDPNLISTHLTNNLHTTINNTNLVLFINFKFWFCKNSGQAIPLICLNNSTEFCLRYKLRPLNQCFNRSSHSPPENIEYVNNECILFGKFARLSKDERIRFTNSTHEYLIEQVNKNKKSIGSFTNGLLKSINLNFNGPVKQLIWFYQYDNNNKGVNIKDPGNFNIENIICNNNYFQYSANTPSYSKDKDGPVPDAPKTYSVNLLSKNYYPFVIKNQLKVNQQLITPIELNSTYFQVSETYSHGYNIPSKFIYTYSFALKPREHQPSGTLNFSEISSFQIDWTGMDKCISVGQQNESISINVYAINYNILRFASGQAGLAYTY